MREAETDSHEGKRKVEALWPIFIIKSRDTSSIYSTEEMLSAEVILLTCSSLLLHLGLHIRLRSAEVHVLLEMFELRSINS
jgi:hypothetical protein